MESEQHPLGTTWVLWSHPWDSKRWELKDYIQHARISTVEQFWEIFNGFASLNNRDMWFLMRDGIPPIWEHPINREGGSFKFRVSSNNVDNTWLTLCIYLVSENMCLNPKDAELISGIGISPKSSGWSTISIWNLDSRHTANAIFPSNINGINFSMSMYQAHSARHNG